MTGYRLKLTAPLEARLDFSGVTPAALAGLGLDGVARKEVLLGTRRVLLGDLFEVSEAASEALVVSGDPRLDFVAADLADGEILVEGPVGVLAGARMSGGRLVVRGDAGESLAAGLTGGRIEVSGAAGARLGCALPGERLGMRGGMVSVAGDVGAGLGERLRGGLVLVGGNAGAGAANDLIAGTIAVAGRLGPDAGRGMRRGTLILAQTPEPPAPGFVDTGSHDLVALLLLARRVPALADLFGGGLSGRAQRLAGNRLVGGEGEILLLQ
ncbi:MULTISPECIES: formylmethanofuran dehydrogenase subunit C [Xanthobacter]|uniref:formylmethanofuran dehydrogenase subunit C n=1 Tax=Xanthobacter TaxID=279 RepID=UPI001F00C902|nr:MULTISPECIES: formylmethanofuran dehydrogenase subunit C [unclassified Xanthobacter]